MDPMTEIGRELSAAMQVDASVDFAARVRMRIASESPARGWQVPRLALGAIGCATLLAVMTNVMTVPVKVTSRPPLLLTRQNVPAISALRSAVQPMSPVIALPAPPMSAHVSNVIVSRSEMLALQQLFSGATVMPPAREPGSDELSIPVISIDPIPAPANSPGERQ